MPTRNTMVVPCIVKNRLNVSGGTTWRPDHASWRRIIEASRPAITRKTSPVATYMIPRRLWSTVTTHSWSSASKGGRATAPALITAFGITLMEMILSAQRQEVRGHLVHVLSRELHGRHQSARLDGRGIHDPVSKRLRSVLDHSGADRRPAHQVRKVWTEHAVGRGPTNGVTADAGER